MVTEHCFNLYADLLDLIGQSVPSLGAASRNLCRGLLLAAARSEPLA